MRWLVKAKIWRAYPELDRFDDESCRRFLKRAARYDELKAAQVAGRWARHIAAGIACVALFPLLTIGVIMLFLAVPWRQRPDEMLAWGTALFVGAGVSLCTVLLLRDYRIARDLHRVLFSRRCACGYSFLGLAMIDGHVRCPECGFRREAKAPWLTPEEFAAGVVGPERSKL